jgi:hypothetical protein
MFGESNTAGSIGPSRRGLWVGIMAGCLLLATGAVLVSGTVDGLNLFGGRLADSTPSFPDPPRDEDARNPQTPQNPPRPEHAGPLITTQSASPASPAATGAAPGVPHAVSSNAASPVASLDLKRPAAAAAASTARPACTRPGYAALLEPATDPIGTALARSLTASDLQTRIIELSDASGAAKPSGANSGATKQGLSREDVDRIMAGDGSSVTGQIKEGTLVVAQLKVQVRQTVIAEAPMTEVGGTMDLAIVRNNCGTITVQRHRDVYGRSVNETLDDGIRGLGEIFKEKIADLVGRSQ